MLFLQKITILKILISGFIATLSVIISWPLTEFIASLSNKFGLNEAIGLSLGMIIIVVLPTTFESIILYLLFRSKKEQLSKIVMSVLLANIVWGAIGLFQNSGGCKYFTKFYSKSLQAHLEQRQAENEGRALPEGCDRAEMIQNVSEGKKKRTIVKRTTEGEKEKKGIIEVVE